MKSGNFNFLESSGPHQVCDRTAYRPVAQEVSSQISIMGWGCRMWSGPIGTVNRICQKQNKIDPFVKGCAISLVGQGKVGKRCPVFRVTAGVK
jgi:hypothetical protein